MVFLVSVCLTSLKFISIMQHNVWYVCSYDLCLKFMLKDTFWMLFKAWLVPSIVWDFWCIGAAVAGLCRWYGQFINLTSTAVTVVPASFRYCHALRGVTVNHFQILLAHVDHMAYGLLLAAFTGSWFGKALCNCNRNWGTCIAPPTTPCFKHPLILLAISWGIVVWF